MTRGMTRQAILSGLLALLAITVSAQSDTLRMLSLQEAYRQNSWLEGANPAGLSFNRFRSFSIAGAEYSHLDGNLGNIALPRYSDRYSIRSESFRTMGKVTLYGKLDYAQHQRRQVSWNGMTGDYWQGVNLCDSVSGKQRSGQYRLAGAFSVPVHHRWMVGAQFDYQVQLTAKDTDPRNKNQWMEWKLAPGAGYLHGNFRWGASLLYADRKETVEYRNIGTHVVYPFLAAYPLAFFRTLPRDAHVNWHYTSQEAGGAIQSEFTHGTFQLFQQMSGSATKQSIESDRIQNRKEGETNILQMAYMGKLKKLTPHTRHEWSWKAMWNQSRSYEPIQQQDETGAWSSYGKVPRSTRRSSSYALTYGYYRLRDAWNPRFSAVSGIAYYRSESTLLFYPAKYTQPVRRSNIHTTLTRSFTLPNALLGLSLGGAYEKGAGTMMREKQLKPGENAPGITLWQNQDRLKQEFKYATAPRWMLKASLTYTRTNPLAWFISLSAEYEQADNPLPDTDKRKFTTRCGLFF